MNQLTEAIVTILVGITGVAILAVLVSRRSDTKGVIGALFGGYATALGAAVSPISGNVVSVPGLHGYGDYASGFGR
jgi:PRD1 phage membrane DNA delivery